MRNSAETAMIQEALRAELWNESTLSQLMSDKAGGGWREMAGGSASWRR